MRANRRLLRDFVVRDLKGRYIGSSMGFFWSVIFPLINLAIYTFVFRFVLNSRWSDQQPAEQVILLMFAGIVVWSAFAETISRSTNTLVDNGNLIQKVVFPSEILPAYLAISSWINMCIGLVFVLLGVVYLGYVDPLPAPERLAAPGDPPYLPVALGAPLVLLPLLFALQIVFALGLGYLLAALNLFVRDVFHLIGVFLTVWMFATPIFYPAVMVERAHEGKFAWMLDINPMYWLIDAYRGVLLFATWPDVAALVRFAAVALVTFALGVAFFQKHKRQFPDLL
jgi:ABC-type polysaccharide/polyol phosphate export permease